MARDEPRHLDELWVGLNRRHVEDRGLTWEDAVPKRLAYGWIDSKAGAHRRRPAPPALDPVGRGRQLVRVINIAIARTPSPRGGWMSGGLRPSRCTARGPARRLHPEKPGRRAHCRSPACGRTKGDRVLGGGRHTTACVCVGWVNGAKQQTTQDRAWHAGAGLGEQPAHKEPALRRHPDLGGPGPGRCRTGSASPLCPAPALSPYQGW